MTVVFECPVGAAADAKELEYIAALQQTDHAEKEQFLDASIEAVDIKWFLMSRYGIKVSEDQVRNGILFGLGGGKSEDDCIDLVEVVAMLLIPLLLKVSQASAEETEEQPKKAREDFPSRWEYNAYLRHEKEIEELKPSPTIIADVLKIILLDATGSEKPQRLTKELLRSIFAAYGEAELVHNDSIIEGMIEAATGADPDGVLDTEAFARALTSDVQVYDTESETRVSTHFEDVFGSRSGSVERKTSEDGEDITNNASISEIQDRSSVRSHREDYWEENDFADEKGEGDSTAMKTPPMAFTLPEIDFTAENFRDQYHVIIVWISLIIAYFTYVFNESRTVGVCDSGSMGCIIGQKIFSWTFRMGVLCALGSIYVTMLCFGNNIFRCTIFDIFVGVCGVGLFIIVPSWVRFNGYIFRTDLPEDPVHETLRNIHLYLGYSLLGIQFRNVLRMFVLPRKLLSSGKLSSLFMGGNAYAEFQIKRAAVFKTNQMVKRAYELHQVESDRSRTLCLGAGAGSKSTNSFALLNFTKISEKTEPVGGFIWVWKSFLSGDLNNREGIWLHTRLIAANWAQFVITVVLVIGASWAGKSWIGELYPSESAAEPLRNSVDCGMFDPNNCLYPSASDGNVFAGIAVCSDVTFKGDGCNEILWEVATDKPQEELEKACEELSALANETFDCSVLDSIPKLYYPGDTVYSFSKNSTTEDYCKAAVSVCLTRVSGDGVVQEGDCILGMDSFPSLPFQFSGETCDDIPKLSEVFLKGEEIKKGVDATLKKAEETVDSITPEKWMVQLSLAVGIIAAFCGGAYLFLSYIPSTVSTILKFRTGVIPSLRDPNFPKYRGTLEDVTYLLGLIFWGVAATASCCVLIFGGATFFMVWQVTFPYFKWILATGIGIGVTLVFKTIVIKVLGKLNYAAFYRKRPVVANVAGVALECWHLGLTVGYIFVRAIKLIVCAAVYVGRVDKPFLADGVGQIGPVNLDKFPHIFCKDLLSADAHRHPYIERLGVLYMLKLKHGDRFGRQPNSIWRLLFVFALMPWLRKYRILGDADLHDGAILQMLAQKGGQEPSAMSDLEARVAEVEAENEALRKENEELKQSEGKEVFA